MNTRSTHTSNRKNQSPGFKGKVTLATLSGEKTITELSSEFGVHQTLIHRWVKPQKGISAIYSLRITQSFRATALREGDFMHFLTISADHDATYGKK